MGGSLKGIPENLKKHLAEGGRMVVVAGSEPVQRCILITRNDGAFFTQNLFETLAAPLQEKSAETWYKATGKFHF